MEMRDVATRVAKNHIRFQFPALILFGIYDLDMQSLIKNINAVQADEYI